MRGIIMAGALLFCLAVHPLYLEAAEDVPPAEQAKTADINKDGKADVTYYHDGEHINKVEADTDYDGKPDVVIYAEDGDFKSAEADTDYDGKPDKKFSDPAAFKEWLNKDRPAFKEALGWDDWSYAMINF